MNNTKKDLEILNTSFDKAVPIMCMFNEKLFINYLTENDDSQFVLQTLKEENGKDYDVITLKRNSNGEEYEIYFDVTPFKGRGGTILLPDINLPPTDKPYLIQELLGDEGSSLIEAGKSVGVDLSQTTITFKLYSSEMLSRYVAMYYWQENNINVTPLRSYYQKNIPILHGYYFYRMMIDHQIQHILDKHNIAETEVEPKPDYYCPKPGKDCVKFSPLPEFNFANDLINYTFYTHRPKAFMDHNEVRAFMASLQYGFSKKLFSQKEVEMALKNAKLDKNLQQLLIDKVGIAFAGTDDLDIRSKH